MTPPHPTSHIQHPIFSRGPYFVIRNSSFFRHSEFVIRHLLLLSLALLASACSTYVLRGTVVSGPTPSVFIVKPDDPRLANPDNPLNSLSTPIANASVQLVLDPNSAGRQILGSTFTNDDGSFEIPIKQFGAGSLQYQVLLTARAPNHSPVQDIFDLPSSKKRILVTLPKGHDYSTDEPDPMQQLRQFSPHE
jgi:hypothetical protein